METETECLLAALQFDTYTSTVRNCKTLQSLDITSVHKYYLAESQVIVTYLHTSQKRKKRRLFSPLCGFGSTWSLVELLATAVHHALEDVQTLPECRKEGVVAQNAQRG